MATFGVLPGYRNVLIAHGPDVYSGDSDNDYRQLLRDKLYDFDRGHVRRGTHDFWVTYPVPQVTDRQTGSRVPSEHAHEDMGLEPRPMRGLIRMNELPADLSIPNLKSHLRVVFEEIGHHWLVPDDLAFRDDNGDEIRLDRSLADHLIDGEPIDGLPLLGRENVHWSPYWDADASPLNGQGFERLPDDGNWQHWRHSPTFVDDPPLISNHGLPFFFRGLEYNDLELAIMGMIDPQSAYHGGLVRWLTPRLAAPLEYEAGIFVAFSRVDMLRFGFFRDHRVLVARRTGEASVRRVSLGDDYHPTAVEGNNAVRLRIVRRGDTYFCQARYSRQRTDIGSAAVRGLFDELDNAFGRTSGSFEQWRTVRSLDIPERPRAVGLYVLTREVSRLAEAAFYNLEIRIGSRTIRHRFENRPDEVELNKALTDVPQDELRTHIPAEGARVETRNNRLIITAPFNHEHDKEQKAFAGTSRIDRMPKVIRSVPDRDFAVGTVAWMRRSILPPWAAGDAKGRDYWGREGSIPANRVILPDRQAQKRERPRDGVYRVAFIVVAPDADTAKAVVPRVDGIRSAWQAAFSAAASRNDARDGRSALTDL